MFLLRSYIPLAVSLALLVPPVYASHVHRSPTAGHTNSTHKVTASQSRHRTTTAARHGRGQQAIQPERVTQIQQALIREHYLDGEANGSWDSTTIAAMQKYQADHGWQTRLMPDARALKNLGLGPDYSGAINAPGANFSAPPVASTNPAQTAGFVVASGVNQ